MKKVAILLSLIISVSAQIKQQTVAILDFEGIGINNVEKNLFIEKFVSEIGKNDSLIIIPSEIIETILNDKGIYESVCASLECGLEIGQILGVDYIINGSIIKVDDLYSFQGKVIDVKNESKIKSIDYNQPGEMELMITQGIKMVTDELSDVNFIVPDLTNTKLTLYKSNSSSDNTPPVLTNLTITPQTVDVRNNSEQFTVTVSATDDDSGLQKAWLWLESPSGSGNVNTFATFDGSLSNTTTWSPSIGMWSEPGDWYIKYFRLYDITGNYKDYSKDDLSGLGFPNKISVTSNTDSKAPVLTNYFISPDTVNNSGASRPFYNEISATDDSSGLQKAWLWFESPSGTGNVNTFATFDGSLSNTTTWVPSIGESKELGDWYIKYFRLYDITGNYKDYSKDDLTSLGFPNKVVVDANAEIKYPIVLTTKTATSIIKSSAYFNGYVSTYGGSHQFYFQYGKDSNVAENEKDVGVSISAVTSSFNTGVKVENLIPVTNYSFRLISKSSSGEVQGYGNTLTFATPSNTSPVISTINDITVNEDASGTATLDATDADGDAITYSAVSDTNAVTVSISSSTLTLTPNANWHGVATIEVYASDGSSKDSTSFKLTVTPVQDVPTAFEWVSSALDTINIAQSNLADTYTLQWDASTDVDGDSITYLLYAGTGASPKEEVYNTTSTSLPIPYQEFLQKTFEQISMLSRATAKFSVSATDGIDTVKVTGDDRFLFVNRYEYLSTESEGIPIEFALHENYPNPFNPTTTLRFDLPEVSSITLTIYNMLGQKVRTFNYQNTSAGYHSVKWNANNDYGDPVGAGVYLYQLQTKHFVKTRKMVLLK